MKKVAFVLFTISLCISSCTEKKETVKEPVQENSVKNSPINGTWKMVYGEIREGDSVQVKDLTNTDFIKILNNSHFSFFNQHPTDSTQFYGGAGNYTLVGNAYKETLNYTSVNGVRGHTFPFTIEIKGDTLIQFGLEEIKEANIKRHIVEKYLKIE